MKRNRKTNKLRPSRCGDRTDNPGGTRRALPISDAFYEILEQRLSPAIRKILNRRPGSDLKRGASFADAITAVLFANAVTGDPQAIREITDRVEGRPSLSDEFSAQPPTITVVWPPLSAEAARLAEPSNSVRAAHEQDEKKGNRGS